MKLASIEVISAIRSIPGADRIQAAAVLGYQTVIKSGEFAPGDLCVWHEPDTVVAEREEYEFLRKQAFRLKVSKFKGQVSQGLALPLKVLPPGRYTPGTDVTELTGIRKYEKLVPPGLAGLVKGAFPTFVRKTDEPNLRSFPTAMSELFGRPCVITQKVDGTSGTFFVRNGEFGVCSRNLELMEEPKSVFWRVAREFSLPEALTVLRRDVAIQGEVHGEGIQGNNARYPGVGLAAFSLFDVQRHKYEDHAVLASFCQRAAIPMVRVIWEGEFQFTLRELIKLANAQDAAPGIPAEGIVIRPLQETSSTVLPSGRLSVKVISERYALKHGE